MEDYKKKYEQALGRAKNYREGHTLDVNPKSAMEYVFPELKESEDERIRKEIIKFLQLPHHQFVGKRNHEDCVAWLEKQGKQKPMNKVEPKFKVGQTIKKEGFNLGFTIVKIEDGFYYNDIGNYFPFTGQDDWEVVEQNPAWSKEDKVILDEIIDFFENGTVKLQHDLSLYASWLKSLRLQFTWKPSDEQMQALSNAGNSFRPFEEGHKILWSLYNDLKKLREE